MENFDIKNKDQREITKELKNDFKNFEDRKKWYDEELHDLWIKHLENYRKKINAAITKIGNIPTIDKQKHSAKCTELTNRLNAAKEEINNKTLKLNLWWMAYKFHHDEHLNAIWSAIDRYEDDAIDTIKNLIEDINDDEQIQAEKGNVDNANKQRTYVEIDDNWIYRLTKHTNRPRIHEVLWGVINEWELWKIDYSSCTNQYIKNKMASAISSSENYTNTWESYSCYLQYDKNQNTYVLSDWDGHVLQQRALIREWVQLTPPSKIKWEAKLAKRERES